jgi:hypothetical protein
MILNFIMRSNSGVRFTGANIKRFKNYVYASFTAAHTAGQRYHTSVTSFWQRAWCGICPAIEHVQELSDSASQRGVEEMKHKPALVIFIAVLVFLVSPLGQAASRPNPRLQSQTLELSYSEYLGRVQAIWTAQMIAQRTGGRFEHQPTSVLPDTPLSHFSGYAPVDDDYYYEMVAVRAFEKYGVGLTVQQLGQQWLENNAGSWGSSEQALLLMKRGIRPPDTGHPRYNKLRWTIGPQFSSDVYGALSPGMPNVAAEMARRLGPRLSLRKCLDMIIAMADAGTQPEQIFRAIDERWGMEYPATNNAVVNGGFVATSVWFGGGDFQKTIQLAVHAADFSDADCNAANAESVVAAMGGMRALPSEAVSELYDRVKGASMGPLQLTPPVDESITELAKRTAKLGVKILLAHGVSNHEEVLRIPNCLLLFSQPLMLSFLWVGSHTKSLGFFERNLKRARTAKKVNECNRDLSPTEYL